MALGPVEDPSFVQVPDAGGRARINGFSFEHAAAWLVYPGLPIQSTLNQTVGYVSTQSLENRCAHKLASGGMVSETCGPVLDRLSGAHGVLVRWISLSMPGQKMSDVPGAPIALGGHEARWSLSLADPACAAEGGTTSVAATLLLGSTGIGDSMLQLSACLVSADDVAAVRAMADSLEFDAIANESPKASAAALVTDTTPDGAVTVTHDPRWRMLTPAEPLAPVQFVSGYLSTEPVSTRPCETSADGASSCGGTVVHLREHGVFVSWIELYFPGQHFTDAGGEKLVVDGKPARWSVARDGSCAEFGAPISVEARVLREASPSSDHWITGMSACVVSADDLPAVKAMFASARFAR